MSGILPRFFPRPQRWPRGLTVIYLALVVTLVWILRTYPGLDGKNAVPAMAPGYPATSDRVAPSRLQGILHGILRMGLPLIDVYRLGAGEGPGIGDVVRGLARVTTGIVPGKPFSLLQAQMPVLALVASPETGDEPVLAASAGGVPGTAPEPPPRVPFQPGDKPLVIVYQTHSQESFMPELVAVGVSPQGSPYSSDQDLNITRVGEELARALQEEHGIATVHLRDAFDRSGLTGAYMESETGVRAAMERHPNARILLDIHRDSAPRETTTTVIGGKPVARVLFVVGMGNEHLPNPNWQDNQEFGRALAMTLDAAFPPDEAAGGQRYPPLVRQMKSGSGDPRTYARNGRFNQHLSRRAILIEVGGPGNTMAEALRTARMVAYAVARVADSL